ncbi:unnamed protein product, partial [Timema podura]|nr:unnamed protein product [Timema podura]
MNPFEHSYGMSQNRNNLTTLATNPALLGQLLDVSALELRHESAPVVLAKASYVAIQIIVASVCIDHNQAHINTNILLPTSLNQCVVKLCSSNLAGVRLLLVSIPNWKQLNQKQDGTQGNSDDNQLVGEDTFDNLPSRFMQTYQEIIGQLLMMLNQEFTWSIMVPGLKITHNIFTVEAIDAYLILLDMCGEQCMLEALVKHLNMLSSEESWNPRARFVVVVVVDEKLVWSSDINLFVDLARQILEKMWAENIYSTTVVLPVTMRNVAREDPGKQHQIDTVEDILKSGMDIGFPATLDGLFEASNNWQDVEILKRRIDLNDYTYYYNRIAHNENFA